MDLRWQHLDGNQGRPGEGIGEFSIFVYARFSNLLENLIASETWLDATNKYGKDCACYASEDRR